MTIGAENIETPCIAAEHNLFVGADQILPGKQSVDLMTALLYVENFMGKIAAENNPSLS